MRVLLFTPPMTQLNSPYPATAYLKGFLKKNKIEAFQADPAIELICRLFSKKGLLDILRVLETQSGTSALRHESVSFFLKNQSRYLATVEPTIRFLQGKDPSLALRLVSREFLPEGPRFRAIGEGADPTDPDPISWAFGALGVQDRAKYLASLFIDDLADVIRWGVDPRFELSRYGEKLAASSPTFEPLHSALNGPPTWVDQLLDQITQEFLEKFRPDVVGLTVPFPGNVYGAFRIAQVIKRSRPEIQVVMGGGYVNTELRQLKEPRVFDYLDYIILDDGERPLLCLLEHLEGKRTQDELMRTFLRRQGKVVFIHQTQLHDIPHQEIGTPCYEGLPLDRYLSIFEMLNPMHRIWSDGRWNKLTLAHGCYWKKCNFCDVSLDYIGRYDRAGVDVLIERIEALIEQTGQSGFHFVDEAAPPAVLRTLAEELIRRGIQITWWGNVRFEKTFTPELARLLARSGCVALSGGLEVASDRLLKLMQKGVSVEQVAQVTHAFTEAGIMVHAYLMYGFPSQTVQETIDALERVRQLFEAGCIQSAYWHRFSVTAHSPIGLNPKRFGIQLQPEPEVSFARNDLSFLDPTPCDHDFLGEGLKKALYNFMHGVGFDLDVRHWFGSSGKRGKKGPEFLVPAPRVSPQLIQNALNSSVTLQTSF
ncbi:MAG: B12-binding domain-containing radical SAM protein [Bdellovibrionia bacterium]